MKIGITVPNNSMPSLSVNGVSLYYEEAGRGFPVVFSHEFAGGYRSWEPQMRFLSRSYRCIAYNHRGFPPSSVPESVEAYSQDLLIEDLRGLVRQLGIERAHFIGCSMGAQTVLMFALRYPELCHSIVVASAGSGSIARSGWEETIAETVRTIREEGIDAFAERYSASESRLAFKRKDPRGYAEFQAQLREHSVTGQALTMLGVQRARPALTSLGADLRGCTVPALLIVGDEDEACVEPSVFVRSQMPNAGLAILPRTGHTVNLEEPDLFNELVLRFLHEVETAG